jgi:hypothetical protein
MTRRSIEILRSVSSVFVAVFVLTSVAAESATCKPIPGAEELLRPGKVLLLGEQHGTEESPGFALDLACHAAEAGLPVRFGIEISPSEQSRVEVFLASSGDEASRRALLEGAPWQAQNQYGVTSAAMYRLFDGLRALRHGDHDVQVVLFNQPGTGGGQARDRRMAEHLAGVAGQSKEALLVVLTGNIHSRVTRGTRWSVDYEPMGHLLSKAVVPERVVALDVAHDGGTAWVCLAGEEGCGSQRFGPRGPGGKGVTFNDSPDATGHHGWYHVGSITASPPAYQPPRKEAGHSP